MPGTWGVILAPPARRMALHSIQQDVDLATAQDGLGILAELGEREVDPAGLVLELEAALA